MDEMEVVRMDSDADAIVGLAGEGDRARRYIICNSDGEVFAEDEEFCGLTLVVEIRDGPEGLRLVAAIAEALGRGVPS